MNAETAGHTLNRRSFLKGVGLGTLSLAGVSALPLVASGAPAAAQPKRFIYAWTAFDILDPHVKYDGNAYFFNLNMYDNLLRYQGSPPEIVPWLAERYDVTEGGRTWTFHLRRGVQFHDGNEVDAEAVRFSFECLLALGKGPAGSFKRMGLAADKVRVLGSHTVEIQLDQPYGPFRAAIPIVSIVNPAVIKAHEVNGDWAEKWLARNEAGSGAFSLVKYDSATGFVMKRFPGYWRGWQEKYMEEVEIRLIRETSSRVLALMKGDIHTADTNFPPDQLEKLERSPRIKVSAHDSMAPCYIKMHKRTDKDDAASTHGVLESAVVPQGDQRECADHRRAGLPNSTAAALLGGRGARQAGVHLECLRYPGPAREVRCPSRRLQPEHVR